MQLGWHWLARVGDVEPRQLHSEATVRALLTDLPAAMGLRPVAEPVVRPVESGLAGMVLLAESHAAVHTLPEQGVAFVDVFSCREFVAEVAEGVLRDAFPGGVVSARVEDRVTS